MIKILVQIKHSHHSRPPDIQMTMLQVMSHRRDKRKKKLLFLQLGDQTESTTSNILIRVNEIITEGITNEDHLSVFWGDGMSICHHKRFSFMNIHKKKINRTETKQKQKQKNKNKNKNKNKK